ALPGHEGDEEVLPEAELAFFGRRPVGEHGRERPTDDAVADVDGDLLVDARVLVGPVELGQPVDPAAELDAVAVALAGVVLDRDGVAADVGDEALAFGEEDVAGVTGG